MRELEEWNFRFGLMAKEPGRLVSEQQASDLMDAIIDYVEQQGLCIGGSFGPFEESTE